VPDRRIATGLLLLGLSLGLSLVAAAAISSRAFLQARSADQALQVKGFAERSIESDLARWRGSFTTRAPSLDAAYAALAADRERLIALLDEAGVPPSERSLAPVSTQVLFERDVRGNYSNRVEGYALRQQVVLTSLDIDRVQRVMRASDELIRAGIEFESHQTEFFYTKLGELKIDMLREATTDGRRRAETLADAGGGSLGHLVSARQGVFQITPEHSTEISDYGRNDTSTRQKTIKAVVTLEYTLERP
jgi:hypothetical protein